MAVQEWVEVAPNEGPMEGHSPTAASACRTAERLCPLPSAKPRAGNARPSIRPDGCPWSGAARLPASAGGRGACGRCTHESL